ncbi:DZAN1-like protein [Mya arenaria]|uniref:DZAN1-like protein n=1 Tax=Mya arenaria TaxID=6604 RepID=A0ABY7FGP4_MYAAR|nr:DZAN1-like protein [Mya arenaria]
MKLHKELFPLTFGNLRLMETAQARQDAERAESNGAKIYYTINATKPDPFPKVGMAKYTMEYQGPFTLPAGKQTVKALALGADGIRESNVVTKVFEVEYVASPMMPPVDDDFEFQEDLEKQRTMLNVRRAQKDLMMSSKSAWTDVRNTNNRMGGMGIPLSSRSHRTPSPRRRQLPDNTTQAMRLQRETDFLKCVYCFADRPSDPYARFCNTCGNSVPPVPQTRIPPPEPGQASFVGQSAPPITGLDKKYLKCTKCNRVNRGEARFCDWCGAKAQWLPVSTPLGAPPRPSLTVATQTVGLFYPSTRGLEKEKAKEEEKIAYERQMRDRRPLLTAVSPGKGYWRKQVEHICQHIKAHTQNDAEFRALIGEPKMGKKQDGFLLKELGPGGDGDPSEGSDPNCVNKNNIPMLHIAAKNKRADSIPVLVDSGAEINKKGPSAIKGNTALHEAVSLGPSGGKVVDELLSCGADQNTKNDKGESPYDMAVKGGYENLVKKFAANLGQAQLDKLIKPKTKGS